MSGVVVMWLRVVVSILVSRVLAYRVWGGC